MVHAEEAVQARYEVFSSEYWSVQDCSDIQLLKLLLTVVLCHV